MGHPFFWNLNALARARVAAHTGRAAVDGEAAKATNLNAVAFDQGVAHGVKHRFDGQFGITVGQLRKACSEFFNQIGACHGVTLMFVCLTDAQHRSEKSLPP